MVDVLGPADAPNAVTARPDEDRIFGADDTWFKDCSSPFTNDGTKIKAGWLNGLLGNIRALVRVNGNKTAGGAVVSEANANGLLAAGMQHLIQRGQVMYALASGSANAITVTLAPAPAEYKTGMLVRTKLSAANTLAAVTLNVNGLGALTVKTPDGAPPAPGDLFVGRFCEFVINAEAAEAILISAAMAMPVVRLGRSVVFMSSGTWVVPDYVKYAHGRVWSGGGGGAGSWLGGGANGPGGGGGSGAYVEGWFSVPPGASISITVGAGGAAGGIAGNGGAGGSSSLGVFMSATGGGGGKHAADATPGYGGSPGAASGGEVRIGGGIGGGWSPTTLPAGVGGSGAAAPMGGSGGLGNYATGSFGTVPGGGGSGQGGNFQAAGQAGGAGMVIISW